MKKLLIVLLLGFFPFLGKSQQILPISTSGAQQASNNITKVIVNPGDSLVYLENWCLNGNCLVANLDTSSVNILFGATSSIDTISITNVIEIQNISSQPVIYYVQRLLINLITLDTIGNITMPVTIYPDFSPPLVNYISAITTTDSVTVVYSVVPNDTSAQLKFWLRYQDCIMGNAYSLPVQTVSGFNILYLQYKIPQSFSCGYELGIKLELINSVGIDTTGFACTTTLSCGNPYVTTYDSILTSTTTANLFGRVETMNQNCLVVDSVALPNQSYFAGTSINIVGSQSTSNAFTQITNLAPGTTYWFKRCVFDSSGVLANCQGPVVAVTEQMPVLLAFDIAGSATTSSTNQRIDVQYTSSVDGTLWSEISNDSNFGIVVTASPNSVMNFFQGQTILSYDVSMLSGNLYNSSYFQNGMKYWVRFRGNNQNGEMAVSAISSFIFGNTTGISEIPELSSVFVANDELVVVDSYTGELVMVDMTGRVVGNFQKIDFGEVHFPLYSFKTGVYVLQGVGIRPFKFSISRF